MRGYDAAAAVSLLGASAADAADGRFSVALDRMVGNPQAPPQKQRFGELHEQAGGGVAYACRRFDVPTTQRPHRLETVRNTDAPAARFSTNRMTIL